MNGRWISVAAILLYGLTPAHAKFLNSDRATMQRLAQEHSNDMARRDQLDHAGFESRANRSARAENVAYDHSSKAMTIAQWSASPPHAANMRLAGCKGIASAVSRSGRRYWTMEIGQQVPEANETRSRVPFDFGIALALWERLWARYGNERKALTLGC